jgi:hypothetical protein
MWGFVRLLETMIDNSHVGTPKRWAVLVICDPDLQNSGR